MSSTAAGADRLEFGSPQPEPDRESTVVREHYVDAVLVAHNGQRWLPRALRGLADAERAPDRLVAVDTGSTDRTAELLADSAVVADVVTMGPADSFARAVAAGAAPVIDLTGQTDGDTIDLREGRRPAAAVAQRVDWVWVLHDDCVPAPDALAQLLRRADQMPGAEVLGPKLRSWHRGEVLQECGLALSTAGRPETGVAAGEVDQGQLDGRTDVMAVSSAGMLVRRDLWDRLGGFSESFADQGCDIDFCWRAHRAGARVVVAPRAVVFHRRSATTQQRPVVDRRGSQRHQHRRTAVMTALVQAPLWRLPFTVLRTALGGLLRFLLGLVTLSPRQAWDDLTGTAAGLLSWRRVTGARRSAARTAVIPERELRYLRATLGQRVARLSETFARPNADDDPGLPRRARHFGRLVAVAAGILTLVSLFASWELWFGAGRIAGGALLPAPDGTADLLSSFLAAWHEVGLGSDAPAPPYLAVLAAVSVGFLGSATAAIQILLLAAPVTAGIAMMLALRGIASRPLLLASGLAYALVPTTLAAVDSGRLGTAVAAALLPLTARLLLRTSGFDTPLPPGNRRTVVAAAVMVAALGAFVPVLAITLVTIGLVCCVAGRRRRGAVHMLLIALATVALLWPWSGSLLSAPGRLLLEVGAQLPGQSTEPVWQLGLLDPGGPGTAPAVTAVALVALAVLALIPSRTRRAVVLAWLVILTGLLLALVQSLATVEVTWSAQPVSPWPGPGTLLMSLGAVTAVVLAARGLHPRRIWGRSVVAVLLITPVIAAAWWLAEGESVVKRQDPGVVSPFVSVASLGPEAPRSLALEQRPDATVTYELLSGVGPRIGDADVAPPVETLAGFNSAVSRMTAGSGAALEEVAQAAVRFVTVAVDRDRELARQLDAVPGLRRVSTIDGQGLWEVVAPVARVRAVTPDGAIPLVADAAGPSLSAAGPLPAGATAIQLSELSADGWRAGVPDIAFPSGQGSWQTFDVPVGAGGDVVVSFDTTSRALALLVPVAGLLALLAAAMGMGRGRRGSADPYEAPADPVAEPVADGELEVVR